MVSASTFSQSIGIAINRSATQVASILITAILGFYSIRVLAEFSLALTFAAILFAIVTTIQMGVQAEFGKRFIEKNVQSLYSLFKTTLLIVCSIACILAISIWIMPNPFSSASSVELAINAVEALKILALSLPLVGALTTITFFLESIGQTKQVVILRTGQVLLQVGFVLTFILVKQIGLYSIVLSAKYLAVMYVLSDLLMLGVGSMLLYVNYKKQFHDLSKPPLSKLNLNNSFLFVAKLGFPAMFGMIGQRVIFYGYANLIASLGILQMSAFSIMNSLVFFVQIPLLGVAHLMTIKIGKALGEKKPLILKNTSSEFIKLFIIELSVIAASLYLLLPFLLKLMTDDIAVLQLLESSKPLILLYFIMNAALTFSVSALRGYSDTLMPQLIILFILSIGTLIGYITVSDQIGFGGIIITFSFSGLIAAYCLFKRMCYMQRSEFAVLKIHEAI